MTAGSYSWTLGIVFHGLSLLWCQMCMGERRSRVLHRMSISTVSYSLFALFYLSIPGYLFVSILASILIYTILTSISWIRTRNRTDIAVATDAIIVVGIMTSTRFLTRIILAIFIWKVLHTFKYHLWYRYDLATAALSKYGVEMEILVKFAIISRSATGIGISSEIIYLWAKVIIE